MFFTKQSHNKAEKILEEKRNILQAYGFVLYLKYLTRFVDYGLAGTPAWEISARTYQ